MKNYEKYGVEAEIAVLSYLKENSGLNYEHNDANSLNYNGSFNSNTGLGLNSSPIKRMDVYRGRYGDIVIDFPGYPLKMNVVRGTWVSHTSVERFKGHLYCIFPEGDITDISKGRVILSSTLKNYKDTCKSKQRKDEIIANKSGFRYRNLKAYMTLNNFNNHLTKMIIMGITMEYNGNGVVFKEQSQDFWKTLKHPFIGDYKKKFQEAATKV